MPPADAHSHEVVFCRKATVLGADGDLIAVYI